MANELVLVVEDNLQNRKLARDLLQVHGYRVVEAETAEDGLQRVAKDAPDLVVMDIHLPGMSGIDAVRRMRADAALARVPVIAFTASVMPQDRSQVMAAGFDGFVSKPIDLRSFLDAVATALAAGRERRGG
jgi:two-component system cell cycle response regulator DivK